MGGLDQNPHVNKNEFYFNLTQKYFLLYFLIFYYKI